MWCPLSRHEVIGPFCFQEKIVNSTNYLDMLELFSVPQMSHLQQNGAHPYWGLTVREYMNKTFPNKWILREGPIPWSPYSPDIIPLDFFGVYIKVKVFRTEMWLNFVQGSTTHLFLWHPRCWKAHGVKSSTIWTFCNLQMAPTLRCFELDNFFFQAKKTNYLYS